jgi:hypothetical protein
MAGNEKLTFLRNKLEYKLPNSTNRKANMKIPLQGRNKGETGKVTKYPEDEQGWQQRYKELFNLSLSACNSLRKKYPFKQTWTPEVTVWRNTSRLKQQVQRT